MEIAHSDDVHVLKELLAKQTQRNDRLEQLIEKLQFQIESLLRKLYGKRSEKQVVAQADASVKVANLHPKAQLQSKDDTKPRRVRAYPTTLSRECIIHDLPKSALACCCGRKLQRIGSEKTEQLDFKPASLFVKEHVRFKYACCCGLSGVKIASYIDKSNVLSVMVMKYHVQPYVIG